MVQCKRNQDVLARKKTVWVGADVHKESWQITALVDGEVVFRGRIPPVYEKLRALLDRFPDCEIWVAYEAGPCGYGLYDKLEGDKIRCLVAAPSLIPIQVGKRVKTDRRDSLKLAELLAAGQLTPVFVLTEEERCCRDLVRTRQQVAEHRRDVMRQIKAKLLFHSLNPPGAGRGRWSKKYLRGLRTMEYSFAALRSSFICLLDIYEFVTVRLSSLDKEIEELSQTEAFKDRVELLRSVPGISYLTAMIILTELGDLSRFSSNDEFASFLGLTPSEFSSGPVVRKGRITRCGNERVRRILIESSWTLIQKDPRMRKKYHRISRRRGSKRAIVAIARTLSAQIRHILLQNEPYRKAAA